MQLTLHDAFALAATHDSAGRRAEARVIYEQILDVFPDHPGALLRLAEQDLSEPTDADGHRGLPSGADRSGDAVRSAIDRLERARVSAEQQALPARDILRALIRAYFAAGDRGSAVRIVEQELDRLAQRPAAGTLTALGHAALDGNEAQLAERCFRRAGEEIPAGAAAVSGLALALAAQRRLDEAMQNAMRAIELAPDGRDVHRVLAYIHGLRGEFREAETAARRGLDARPDDIELLQVLGLALRAGGSYAAARDVLGRCAALAPKNVGVLKTLAACCLDVGDTAAAQRHLEDAIELGASDAEVWDNLGLAYRLQGDEERALRVFERAHAAAPTLTPVLANMVSSQQALCDWDSLDASERKLIATLDDPGGDPRWPPFVSLTMPVSPAQQLQVARRWSRAMLPPPVPRMPAAPRGERLRVGYLSGSFHEHPTARLMVGLFEEHDKSRFEITGYSYGPDDGSALRARLRSAFEHWRDVAALSDAEIAQTIRDDRIDVLIERKGHTIGGRLGILAHRPAPVQIHYMSFPGTIGYDAVDGIIADADVVPPEDERYYHERVWRLPRSYYVNDRRRGLPTPSTRRDNGLPDEALVLACLNQSYKLRRPLFAIWMEALRAAPDAVLWLLSSHARTRANLGAEAVLHGVDASRLIFAPTLAQEAHIARLACMDLALDTLPYGAHTTGVDVLWTGVPMLTCRGETFAGRVGASLLHTAGLPRLVTDTLPEYRARLLELVGDRASLQGFRDYLNRTRATNALFDTPAFARDWEALLLQIHAETTAGR